MSVETVQIRPELDRAALAKAEKDLEKTFSPTGRAVSGLKKDMGAFWRESSKAAAASASGKKNAKDWAKASKDAQSAVARMGDGLKTAESTLGKSHRIVREMRIEYQKASHEAQKLQRASRLSAVRERLGSAVRGAGSALGSAAATGARVGGAVALGAVVGTVAIASKIRAEMDRAAKSANLTVEEFSRLKHAARLSGTSIEAVEKGSRKLQEGLSKAKPSAEFSSGLKALGVQAKDLEKLSPEKRLQLIADGMKGVEDDALKTEIAVRLFGKAGAAMVPLLQNGGAAIQAMGDEAAELGLVFSADAAASAERFGDAQQKLGDAVKGTLTEAFASIVPLLAEVTEGMVEWVKANREIVSGKLQAAVKGLVEFIGQLSTKAQSVDWSGWAARMGAVLDLLLKLAGAMGSLLGQLPPMGAAFVVLGTKIAMATGPLGALAVAAVGVGAAMGAMLADSETAIDGVLAKARSAKAQADLLANQKGIDEQQDAAEQGQRNAAENRANADAASAAYQKVYRVKSEKDLPVELQNSLFRARGEVWAKGAADDLLADAQAREAAMPKPRKGRRKPPTPEEILQGGGGKGKVEKSASEQRIESDLQALAERAGAREYQRVLQAGGTTAEADKAALATQKEARKRLDAQASDLARKGFVGGSGGPSFVGGPATGAGGAVPVSIDLGGQGGPPPVQIINILQNAQIDIPIETAASAEAVSSAVASQFRTVIRQAVAEALPLGSTSMRA